MSAVRASRVAMHSATSPRASFSCMRFAKVTGECSVAVARVEFVENAQVGCPVVAAAAGIVMLILLRSLGATRGVNFTPRLPGRFQNELDFAGIDQVFHKHKGVTRAFADREQDMV